MFHLYFIIFYLYSIFSICIVYFLFVFYNFLFVFYPRDCLFSFVTTDFIGLIHPMSNKVIREVLWMGHGGSSDPLSSMVLDWLIIYGFTSRLRIFHLYGDVTFAGEGLQNLGLCSALRACTPMNREGSLSCHTCCDTGPRFFRSYPKDCPIQLPFTTRKGVAEDLF